MGLSGLTIWYQHGRIGPNREREHFPLPLPPPFVGRSGDREGM